MENTQMSEQERDQIVVDRDWARKLAEYHGRNAVIGSERFESARHVLGLLSELERVEDKRDEMSEATRLQAEALALQVHDQEAAETDGEHWRKKWAKQTLESEAALAREREKTATLEKLLTLAMWMGGTDEGSLRTLLADAEAGEGTYMPSAARVVLAEATVSSERVSS